MLKYLPFGIVVALLCWATFAGDAVLSARVDRLEKDNALQQQIITDLGDKLAAHLNK